MVELPAGGERLQIRTLRLSPQIPIKSREDVWNGGVVRPYKNLNIPIFLQPPGIPISLNEDPISPLSFPLIFFSLVRGFLYPPPPLSSGVSPNPISSYYSSSPTPSFPSSIRKRKRTIPKLVNSNKRAKNKKYYFPSRAMASSRNTYVALGIN